MDGYCNCNSDCIFGTGPEITDELVKVLCKRLDETTLDIITVMLVRNCKLTPADVEASCCSYSYSLSTVVQETGSSHKIEWNLCMFVLIRSVLD